MKYACLLLSALVASPAFAASATTHLLHSPTMNRRQIVFSYAGDLWTVSRQGYRQTIDAIDAAAIFKYAGTDYFILDTSTLNGGKRVFY